MSRATNDPGLEQCLLHRISHSSDFRYTCKLTRFILHHSNNQSTGYKHPSTPLGNYNTSSNFSIQTNSIIQQHVITYNRLPLNISGEGEGPDIEGSSTLCALHI